MGDKTPTKDSKDLERAKVMVSPMTPRKAARRNEMEPSPRGRRALDYDHMAVLFNKKPKIVEENMKETPISSLQLGGYQKKKLVVNVITHLVYPTCVKVLVYDITGFLVITAFTHERDTLLHVANEGQGQIELNGFNIVNQNARFPTASYSGLEAVLNTRSSIRRLGPVTDMMPSSQFCKIVKVLGMDPGMVVDVIGVIVNTEDETNSKGNPSLDLNIFDKDQRTICLSMFGNDSVNLRIHNNLVGKVIAVQRAVTSGYGGRISIQALWYTQIELEPAIEEAYDMFGWYEDFVKGVKDGTIKEPLGDQETTGNSVNDADNEDAASKEVKEEPENADDNDEDGSL